MKEKIMVVDIDNANEDMVNNIFEENNNIDKCDNAHFAFKYLIENINNYKAIFIFLTSKVFSTIEFISSLIQMQLNRVFNIVLLTDIPDNIYRKYYSNDIENIIDLNSDIKQIKNEVNLLI